MELIFTHQNADFDAVASMLAAHKLHSTALPVLPSRQQRAVASFLALYRNGLPFTTVAQLDTQVSIERLILTDTATLPDLNGITAQTPTLIYEHHALERKLGPNEIWAGEDIGATTTLLVERIREQNIALNTLEATVMALGIYSDTGMFTYGGTTDRDMAAAAWLLEQGAVLDTVRRFLNEPLTADQRDLFEVLLDAAEHRSIAGYNVTISTATLSKTVDGINTVTQHLRDLLDVDALFTLVQMPRQIQLVGRSAHDAIHAGNAATHFGGGGHPRAAAAAIYSGELPDIATALWQYLEQAIRPAVQVADLMSHGAQSVDADTKIADVIQRIRRIGHEGYPVLDEQERVVGLLTLRDADKALEHGLHNAKVRAIMLVGDHCLKPSDSVAQLEQTMLHSDWGQIPVVNDADQLLGIVTRTDLIRHWGQKHPSPTSITPTIAPEQLADVLGPDNHRLIEAIAAAAQTNGLTLYVVGGVVRDLLLDRPNYDIDFVLEGDAIAFANTLCQQFGGHIHSYQLFGTAKWHLDETIATALNIDFEQVPDHLDFASARSELYQHPTALPTVYNSGIKLDLRRRDFTINTLALQVSPSHKQWHLLDFYGGQADLERQLIRVLHSLSFVDDPTRILRAIRFSKRLDFAIEPRTRQLIDQALPMLQRITGERLRNELTLLLKEEHPEWGLAAMQRLGVLRAIQPDFALDKTALAALQLEDFPNWTPEQTLLRWHLVLGMLDAEAVQAICERLLFGNTQSQAIQQTATLRMNPQLMDSQTVSSKLTALLRGSDAVTLQALWMLSDDATLRQRLVQFVDVWQHIQPTIDGNTLKQRGLPPGPHYRHILDKVRDAWIDDDVQNERDEAALLDALISEVRDDSV